MTTEKRGTFLGLIEKIPYLKELGVTVVELLPVHQFDPQEGNYWGYMTLNFFAPHQGYAVHDAAAEFREMVRAFHAAGIEVWLDVVYNHTVRRRPEPARRIRGAELTTAVTTCSARMDNTGTTAVAGTCCGARASAARMLILESLRHWANLGVDGFRFDLASAFARDDARPACRRGSPPSISEITALAIGAEFPSRGRGVGHRGKFAGAKFPGLAVGTVERPIP